MRNRHALEIMFSLQRIVFRCIPRKVVKSTFNWRSLPTRDYSIKKLINAHPRSSLCHPLADRISTFAIVTGRAFSPPPPPTCRWMDSLNCIGICFPAALGQLSECVKIPANRMNGRRQTASNTSLSLLNRHFNWSPPNWSYYPVSLSIPLSTTSKTASSWRYSYFFIANINPHLTDWLLAYSD